ncbi:carbamoyl-phosphate synthase L chain, ATP binding domain-containing protein, partial [Piptocephalis cylindrospora]
GYGFLSENATFVEALDKVGVTFIGPSRQAMADMGDKIQSKIIAKESGVNVIPGFNGVVRDAEHAQDIANDIGYPVMLKASAGGGGKGMRIAWNDAEVLEGFRLASSESMSSFGDNRLLVEKFIDEPRHIEIQIIADTHGNTLYLPERECSIQRRNQKVIEEAPSTHLDEETRKAMGEQAVALAKHVNYASAGTVEFLVDSKRNFYFLEMNTRLQVEHPITEYITGVDLVEQMLHVAAGRPLSLRQSDLQIKGWALESRVYAEDPKHYLPSIGTLSQYKEPRGADGASKDIRCDSGVVEGSEISVYYDPMICKLCTWGPNREEAMRVMAQAMDSYIIRGVKHNVPLLREVIHHPRFIQGNISTKFLAEEYPDGFDGHVLAPEETKAVAMMGAVMRSKSEIRASQWLNQEGTGHQVTSGSSIREWDWWVSEGTWDVSVLDKDTTSKVSEEAQRLQVDWPISGPLVSAQWAQGSPAPSIYQFIESTPLGLRLQYHGTVYAITLLSSKQHSLVHHIRPKPQLDLTKVCVSPMPGSVVSVAVKEGDMVAPGAELAVVEAMKMQNVLRASRVGRVRKVCIPAGSSVSADEVIIEFDSEETTA